MWDVGLRFANCGLRIWYWGLNGARGTKNCARAGINFRVITSDLPEPWHCAPTKARFRSGQVIALKSLSYCFRNTCFQRQCRRFWDQIRPGKKLPALEVEARPHFRERLAPPFYSPCSILHAKRNAKKQERPSFSSGSWTCSVLEPYVARSDTRGLPEGRSYPRSQQVIHETSGLDRVRQSRRCKLKVYSCFTE